MALVIAISGIVATETAEAKKRTKAKTTSVAKKKTKRKKSTKKKRRKSSRKRKRTRVAKRKVKTPPAEQPQNDSLTLLVNDEIIKWIPENLNPGGLRVNSVKPDKRTQTAKISLNENFTYLPVSQELIGNMRNKITEILPDSIKDYFVSLNVGTHNYAYYITTIDKLPEQFRKNTPFVMPAEPFFEHKKGMEGDIIAMWPSHGRYYNPAKNGWMWQRPQLFQIVEDTHTMGYILPFVVPMIENAGAYVLLPRERDINPNEVIVDNDTNDGGQVYSQPYYKEKTGSRPWMTGNGEGFIFDLPDFRDTENPFQNGTYRQTTTVTSGTPSVAAWYADIPADGEYAVYVSYKSLSLIHI